MGLISNMPTAHRDKYYIYLHLSSNSTHKWPLRGQVTSAVAWGYSRSHTIFQFITSSVWAKLQRRRWKVRASLSHALRAANPRSADGGEFKRVATHFFLWTQWFTQPKGEHYRRERRKFLILREEFLANGRTEACSLPWHTRGKDPTLQHPTEMENSSPGTRPCRWTPPVGVTDRSVIICIMPFGLSVQTFQAWHNPDMEQGLSWGPNKTSLD